MQPPVHIEKSSSSFSPNQIAAIRRIPLAQSEDEDNVPNDVSSLKERIIAHRLRLSGLMRDITAASNEKADLENTIKQKKSQFQHGEAKVGQAELEEKNREIEMYRREAPRTLSKYNELVRAQQELQINLSRLSEKSQELTSYKRNIVNKIQHINMDEIIERHARGLPDAMAGALRKSAAAIVPFFDYLVIAADTNNRLVDHVGAEIDRFAHVNIQNSPFLSGLLFYCVILIPLLTLISFVRRIFDSSSNLTISHYIIFGNLYFVLMCTVNIIGTIVLHQDLSFIMYHHYEKSFVVANLLLAMYYIWHTMILGVQTIVRPDRGNISQIVATMSVGLHYFIFTWRRVITDAAPDMYTGNYMIYATIFSFILYERMRSMSKKQLSDSKLLRLWVSARSGKLVFSFNGMNCQSILIYMIETWKYVLQQLQYAAQHIFKQLKMLLLDKGGIMKRVGNMWRLRRTNGTYAYESSDESSIEGDNNISKGSRSMYSGREIGRLGSSWGNSESRGFVSIFFGNQDDDRYDDSDDESISENERNDATWWGRFFSRKDEKSSPRRAHAERRGSTARKNRLGKGSQGRQRTN